MIDEINDYAPAIDFIIQRRRGGHHCPFEHDHDIINAV